MPTEASRYEPEEEEQPPVPRPYRCSMKPNVRVAVTLLTIIFKI